MIKWRFNWRNVLLEEVENNLARYIRLSNITNISVITMINLIIHFIIFER